jgi:hypothetical protein
LWNFIMPVKRFKFKRSNVKSVSQSKAVIVAALHLAHQVSIAVVGERLGGIQSLIDEVIVAA